jgi:DNA-binding MarR family transcriptional regulator
MGKPKARSILYRLIEAGKLSRKALLVPLLERGLEPGDDAMLFLLHDKLGATEADIAAALGLEEAALEERIFRLCERDLVSRRAIGPELAPGLALTDRGERIRDVLTANWDQLETALLGELSKKKRKHLRDTLGRFVELLKL